MDDRLLRIGRVRDDQKDFGKIITSEIHRNKDGYDTNVETIMYPFSAHTRSVDPLTETKIPSKFFRVATALLEKKNALEHVAREVGTTKYVIALKDFLNNYISIRHIKFGDLIVKSVVVEHEFGKWEFAGDKKAHFRYVCEIVCDTGNDAYVSFISGAVYCSNNESRNPERMRREFKKLAIIRAIAGLITKDDFEVEITM